MPGLLSTVDKQAKVVDTIRILILEDNAVDARLTLRKAKETGLEIAADVATNSQQFIKYFQSQPYDLVLGDYRLPDWTGLDALRWLRNSGYGTPFILVTGTLGDELAVECMKEGANDYVLKEKLERLPFAIHRALEERRLRQDRDRAERDLRQSEEQFRSIVEGAPFGICQTDENGQIRMANPALVAMLGYASESELLAVDTARQVGRGLADMQKALAQFDSQPSSTRPELTWRQKSGKEISVRLAGVRVRAAVPGKMSYNIFVEDVTQQHALERQFQHSQKMEAVGKLAGGVAHDFNNLLMIIGASADFAGQHKHNPERIDKYVRQIQDATSIATSVTRQLLMFSRKQVLERHVQDLNSIIGDLAKMLPRLLGEDVKLVIRLGSDLPKVNVDRGHIEQVVMNLTVNARDAMATGGNLLIETANVTVSGESIQPLGGKLSPGNYVALSVRDSGVGMNEETKAQIFEPFFTTKERGKGTGLGLSTVYGLVEQNGGKISVESEPGKGSTFTVYFPRAEGAIQVQPRVRRTKFSGDGSETVLYVEDEAALREIARESLQQSGFTVLLAANGAEALDLCKSHEGPIDVLVTDLVMPGMSGMELAQKALQLHPGLLVIYVSGYTEHPMDLQNLGPRAVFLQKPFDMDALIHHIRASFPGTA
ncbi:MAG TPA: response regulator [Candidatus Angelobacter sp.]|nr:response regulator [Candidatus Angelobacter sp.]